MGFSDKCMYIHSTLIVQVQFSNSRQIRAHVLLTLLFVSSGAASASIPEQPTLASSSMFSLMHAAPIPATCWAKPSLLNPG